MKTKKSWNGYFGYAASDVEVEVLFPKIVNLANASVPILCFSVDGGANREIRMTEANDISLTSEFEQARQYKNLTLLLLPGYAFPTYDLMEIGHKNLPFEMTVQVIGRAGKSLSETLVFTAENARMKGMPQKIEDVEGTRALRVRVEFSGSAINFMSPNGSLEL